MPAVIEQSDITVLLLEDHPIPCEGRTHPQGKWGHQPSEPAEYLMVTPCGVSILMCAGWCEARRREAGNFYNCDPGCGQLHRCEDLKHLPI